VWLKDEYGNPPLIVTENGYGDAGRSDDADRIGYIRVRVFGLVGSHWSTGRVNARAFSAGLPGRGVAGRTRTRLQRLRVHGVVDFGQFRMARRLRVRLRRRRRPKTRNVQRPMIHVLLYNADA